MRFSLRRAGRHHNVVAPYLALFVALGGSAYAAATVTSADILDETIQSVDIGQDAVTLDRLHYDSVNGSKIINGSVTGPDVANEG